MPTRKTGIKSTGWRPFTDGGFKRNVEGTDAAGWGIAPVSRANAINILCGPVICDPRHPAFSGARTRSNSTAELTGVAEALQWASDVTLRGERARILYESKHAARMALGLALAKKNINLANRCDDLLLRTKNKIFISVHHVYGPAGNAGNECADIAVSFGTSGFISECDTPAWWLTRQFQVQELSQENRRLSDVEEYLHEARSRWQLA